MPRRGAAVHVDRSRENDFAAVSGRRRVYVGDGRERRIVGRRRVHLHLVADRKRRVQGAPERVHPTEMRRAVLGRWLRATDKSRTRISVNSQSVGHRRLQMRFGGEGFGLRGSNK